MAHKISIIILNWNGAGYLEKFLPSVVRFSALPGCEVVVADNGSTDGSIRMLEEKFPEVRIIAFEKNHGFAHGYNLAVEQTDAEYVVLLNSDIEVAEGWLDPLIALMDSDITIAAVMPKIRSYRAPRNFEYAGASGGFIDLFGYPFCRGRIMLKVEEDRGQYDTRCEIFWATGACMVTRRSLFLGEGGFDADFFAHQEEIDLCWRYKLSGYKIFVEPASVVYHVGGGTLSADSPHKTYLNFKNNLCMLYKNLCNKSLYPTVFARLILDGLSAIVFLLQGKPKMFEAVFKAHMKFYKSLGALNKKRKAVQCKRICTPAEIYRGSIVLAYFAGRKEFDKLGKFSDICTRGVLYRAE